MSKLQERRKGAGLSQSQLSKKSGVNLFMIQKYEVGIRDINKTALITGQALARALACRIEDLIEDIVIEE